MKNSCLYDERWNPNDDVVGDIRKNITNMVFDADDVRAGFENHDSSPRFSIPVSYTHLTLPTKRIV